MVSSFSNFLLYVVLDLGCGTGVCGYCAYQLGIAKEVTFSDFNQPLILKENLKDLDKSDQKIKFVSYDWNNYDHMPAEILRRQVNESENETNGLSIKNGGDNDGVVDALRSETDSMPPPSAGKFFVFQLSHLIFCYINQVCV